MDSHLMGAGNPDDPAKAAREARKEAIRVERDSKTT
jgi:hypothetical protein